jgi:hypothetical protein
MYASPIRRALRAPPRIHRPLGLGTGLGGPLTTSQFSADLQARLSAQSASVQQTIASETGVDTNNARVSQGAQSAATLIQHGYDPNSAADSANLIHAIAGGAALIPGAGPILAGAIEALWLVGNQIACPVTNAFASIGMGTPCGAPPCKTTGGPFTTAQLLTSNASQLPSMPTGSFASLAVPAIATYAAQAGNCKGGMPPGSIVDAVVAVWNAVHAGPPIGYFIPPIAELDGSVTPDVLGLWGQESGTTPAAKAGKDPNVYYGFGPVQKIVSDGYYQSNPPSNLNEAQDWAAFTVPPAPAGMDFTSPRIVLVNSGAFVPPPPPGKKHLDFHLGPPAPPPTALAALTANFNALPIGGKAVVVGGSAVLAAAAGGSLYAFLTQQGIGYFWGKIFDGALEGAKGLIGK